MDFFTKHPITITFALISAVIWTLGNYHRKKALVVIGVVFSVLALLAFVFRL